MSEAGVDPGEAPGPSVESEHPEERIAARRLRIAARNEAKKRQERGEDPCEEEVKEEARESQLQLEQSERRMINLQSDGMELITNIQTAADAKESMRRTELEEAQRVRVERLENEAKSSLEKFEAITSGWTVAKPKVIAQELQETVNSQQQLCALLLEDKNKLISDLQQELKTRDDRYVKDLKKQAEEVDLMIERMESQIKTLMKAYREELGQIENAYEHERKVLLTGNRTKWEQYMQERQDKEMENLTQRMKKVEEYEVILHKLWVDSAEEYNITKCKLDMEFQILQRYLQQIKATYLLNEEKLDYNRQLLMKREEESIIIKSQQKKKITRLQDLLNNLKIRCANQEKQSREEGQNLSEDYQRAMPQYKHIQQKMRHFAAVDAKKFEEVWLMNEAEVKWLAERVLDIDRLIHEQQLGVAWERPRMAFMELSGPIQPQKQARRTALQAASQLIRTGQATQAGLGMSDASVGPESDTEIGTESAASEMEREESAAEEKGKVSTKTLKVLQLLCDEAGFLIESKLLKLLSPLEEDEQSLMKLDSIFSALGIESEDDVYKLADFILKYTHQQREQAEKAEEGETSTAASLTSDLIHPNDVLAALKAFTTQCRRSSSAPHLPSFLDLEGRDESEDAAYWESMANVIPDAKLKLWDALQNGLEKYDDVLTERSELITETEGLQQQNAELRFLLQQSLNSRVSAELEIPPTQVMQLAPKRLEYSEGL
ncbi:dynein regulatory complex protein 1-like [Centroberyx affinis]|uniref:dynein regulatory complex protein 1-like n=1 Tax=Centroberyx affinis TaxID=166261 RepID=UPI003A5C1CC1